MHRRRRGIRDPTRRDDRSIHRIQILPRIAQRPGLTAVGTDRSVNVGVGSDDVSRIGPGQPPTAGVVQPAAVSHMRGINDGSRRVAIGRSNIERLPCRAAIGAQVRETKIGDEDSLRIGGRHRESHRVFTELPRLCAADARPAGRDVLVVLRQQHRRPYCPAVRRFENTRHAAVAPSGEIRHVHVIRGHRHDHRQSIDGVAVRSREGQRPAESRPRRLPNFQRVDVAKRVVITVREHRLDRFTRAGDREEANHSVLFGSGEREDRFPFGNLNRRDRERLAAVARLQQSQVCSERDRIAVEERPADSQTAR